MTKKAKLPTKEMELFEVWAGPDDARDHFYVVAKDFTTATVAMFQRYNAVMLSELPPNCTMERVRDAPKVLVVLPKKR